MKAKKLIGSIVMMMLLLGLAACGGGTDKFLIRH